MGARRGWPITGVITVFDATVGMAVSCATTVTEPGVSPTSSAASRRRPLDHPFARVEPAPRKGHLALMGAGADPTAR